MPHFIDYLTSPQYSSKQEANMAYLLAGMPLEKPKQMQPSFQQQAGGGLNIPKIGLELPPGPEINLPSAPEVKLPSAPEIPLPGGLQLPGVQLPGAQLPQLQIPQGQLPNIPLPGMPEVPLPDIGLPNVKMDLGLPKLPDINLPELKINEDFMPLTQELLGASVYNPKNGQVMIQPTTEEALKIGARLADLVGLPGQALDFTAELFGDIMGVATPIMSYIKLGEAFLGVANYVGGTLKDKVLAPLYEQVLPKLADAASSKFKGGIEEAGKSFLETSLDPAAKQVGAGLKESLSPLQKAIEGLFGVTQPEAPAAKPAEVEYGSTYKEGAPDWLSKQEQSAVNYLMDQGGVLAVNKYLKNRNIGQDKNLSLDYATDKWVWDKEQTKQKPMRHNRRKKDGT